MKNIVRRLFCSVMSITILSVSLPPVTAQTEETEPFPYTIYSRYSTSISSAQLCVNGNLHANAGVSFQSSNMNLNGAVTSENETDGKIEPVYADQRIIETFFPEQTVYNTDSYSCEDTNVAVNQTVFSYEEIELNGNTNLNASIGAYDNIEINGNCFTSNQVVLYSGFGNVTITADSSVSLNGLIYAPFGTVTLSAPNVSVNGIIIAENVLIQSGNANINKNDYFARFIGTVSDGYDFSQIPEKYNGDSDDDELPDIYEKIIGTDPMNFDTDGDALPDGYEVIHLGTDPLFVDTDDNGISDPDEDFDEDGLCNLDEYLNETDPYDPDSDMDGYTDGDEVELYLTDPANPDSDDDGLLDGDEGADGFIYTTYGILFDPLLPDTDGNGISDGAEQFAQTYTYYEEDEDSAVRAVSIDMVAAGVLQNHTNIENILDMDVMCSGVVGLIGAPYDIETLDVTGTATLRFTVDPDKLEDTQLSDLMFLWYDEENDEFVELETSIDEDTNTVSTVVSHFSKYMIVNRIKWFEAWQKEFNYTTSSYDRPICHTVLAIDCSASMLSNDPGSGVGTYRYLAVCNFVDSMDENDKAAIVKYNSNASVICNLTDNKTQLKDKAKAINSSGKTSFDSALLAAVSELKSNIIAPNTRNYIVLLSDGESSVSASTWVELAKCSNLVIHTVCLRAKNATTAEEIQKQENAEATLAEIANRGHGTPYIAKTAEDLKKLYTQVGLGISIDPTDNDADGLPDILEIVGIRCSNGVTVTSDSTKWDTDGDGLLDGQEISKDSLRVKTFHYYHEGGRPICFTMLSDPNNPDSDMDTFGDSIDPNRLFSDKKHIASIKQKDYLQIRYTDSNKWEGNSSSDLSISYGSAQTWFQNPSYINSLFDSGRLTGAEVDSHGCGLIAACDTLFYLAAFHPEANLSYLQSRISFNKSDQTFSYADYMQYLGDMTERFTILRKSDWDSVILHNNITASKVKNLIDMIRMSIYACYIRSKVPTGVFPCIFPGSISFEMNTVLTDNNSDYSVEWKLSSNKERCVTAIKEMLSQDVPVIFCYDNTDISNLLSSTASPRLELFDDSNLKTTTQNVGKHYMVITDFIEFSDAIVNSGKVRKKRVLQISSWGKKYYIDLDYYLDHLSIWSNIFEIER